MIVDAHIHFESLAVYDRQMADLEREGANQFCVLVGDRYQADSFGFKQPQAIWMKWKNPDRAYLFGGIDWAGVFDEGKRSPTVPLVEQAERMRRLGFDGLKLINGKPTVHKALNLSLDGPELRPLLEWLEETRFPVLWHVSDPPEFWSEQTVPEWARSKGWWYDASYPSKARIDREISTVLTRHPRLNLILPHFFFLADRLPEAAEFLEKHPNISIDLAPGVEWMHHLTANREAGRDFFTRYATRIIYGTDIGMLDNATHPDRGVAIRKFLESDQCFDVPPDIFMSPDRQPPLRGLQLPETVLQSIYSRNIHRVLGREKPAPLEREGVLEYLWELAGEESPCGINSLAAREVARQFRAGSSILAES